MTHVLHLLSVHDEQWDEDGLLRPASLHDEGFVHASDSAHTLLAVANFLYRNASAPLVALVLDVERLGCTVRWEEPSPAPPPGIPAGTTFPHIYGPLRREAVVDRQYLRPDPDGGYLGVEPRPATADILDMYPHPEGGWFRETWRTGTTLTPSGYSGSRATATAIHYLLGPGESSRWHRVRSDELWIFNRGGPLELSLGGDTSTPTAPTTMHLGPELEQGQQCQLLVPSQTWQSARPVSGECLVTCVVSPGFDFADFEVTANAT
ncbi:cupin domain-containing protein [Lipingzhangella sp. LS1_29]|uniref:Cupin domain-containing protein n=1 Tax=Lipingzhangella rawalii TaxID=2055835 RepID=A0ABU2H290_9ACTN|nr:cupin domain-containing protein [Lipingzhangella rawalii]MDS1268980.1 cupin domain-containing protein [Lipingzhangella rawalii]